MAAVLAYWAILRSPLLFADDAVRVFTYMSINQGVHGRPFADLVYVLLSNGLFVDISPMTQIMALLAMAWAGMRLHYCFLNPPAGFVAGGVDVACCITALLFVVFPLHFSFISYRFDSLSFGLAMLCATSAFVMAARLPQPAVSRRAYVFSLLIPSLLLTLSLGLYQAMFGIYACCAVLFLAHCLLSDEKWPEILRKAGSFLWTACLAVLLYLPVYLHARHQAQSNFYGLGPHPHVNEHIKLSSITDFPFIFIHNITIFFKNFLEYAGWDVPTAVVIATALLFAGVVATRNISIVKKIMIFLLAICAFPACAGLQLFLTSPYFGTRTMVVVCAFVACLFVMVLAHLDNALLKKGVLCLGAAFALSSACILSAIGNAQRDQYRYEQEIVFNGLEADLMALQAERGLKSFYMTPLEPPACTTLKTLQGKYAFLKNEGSMTFSFFRATKMIAYLPVDYVLTAHFRPAPDPAGFETVIARPNYSIKKIDAEKYVVVLHTVAVEPFTPGRYQ